MSSTDAITDSLLVSVLRRDRVVVAAALATITVASWAYILWLASTTHMDHGSSVVPATSMPGMDMPGENGKTHNAGGIMAPALSPWSVGDALFMLIMWIMMMVGMMTPSAAPMILIYARVGRQAQMTYRPFASTAWFASGYLASWVGFAFLATAAQWGLESAALLTPMMASASPIFGGIALIVAGIYQWTPLKENCLSNCQSPLVFIQRHGGFRREPRGALLFGLRHGAYCIGCCWALMALLFVGGVMNVLWIAAIAIFVLLEKIIPTGRLISRIAGATLIGLGIWILT